jgi:hypothetical protein
MRVDRKRLLIGLAGVAVLCVVLAPPGAKKAPPAAEKATVVPVRAQAAEPFVGLPQRRPIGEARGDMFGARSWAPPPPPPGTQQAQPAPPPNPYRFAGTALHAGTLKYYVAEGDRVYEVRPGEELDKGFRVESLSREAIVLVYAPLGAQYRMEVDSTLALPPQRVAGEPAAGAAAAGAAAVGGR